MDRSLVDAAEAALVRTRASLRWRRADLIDPRRPRRARPRSATPSARRSTTPTATLSTRPRRSTSCAPYPLRRGVPCGRRVESPRRTTSCGPSGLARPSRDCSGRGSCCSRSGRRSRRKQRPSLLLIVCITLVPDRSPERQDLSEQFFRQIGSKQAYRRVLSLRY